MKIKHLLFMSMLAMSLSMSLSSCGNKDDDDSPDRSKPVEWQIRMLTHAVHIESGEVESVAIKWQDLWIDYSNNQLTQLTLVNGISRPNIPTLTVSYLPLVKAANRNRYTFNEATPISENVTNLKGYIDFDEQAAKFDYVESRTWRVIAVVPDVYFNNNTTKVTRDGSTYPCTGEMYEFTINPETNRATVKLLNFTFGDTSANFTQIVTDAETPAVVQPTPEGYTITGTNLGTKAYRRNYDPSKPFSDFPIKKLDAKINLESETLSLSMTLGDYTIEASGALK